jgi:hypothetical protein
MNQYTLHTLAAIIFEIAHLATGVALCILGKSLLEKGIRADFLGEGEIASKKIRLLTSSPGIVFLLAGLVVVTSAVFTQSEFVQSGGGAALAAPSSAPTTQTTSRLLDSSVAAPRVESVAAGSDSIRVLRGLATVLVAANPDVVDSYGSATEIVNRIRQARNGPDELRRKKVMAAIDDLAAQQPAVMPRLVVDPEFDWVLSDEQTIRNLQAHLTAQLGRSLTARSGNP